MTIEGTHNQNSGNQESGNQASAPRQPTNQDSNLTMSEADALCQLAAQQIARREYSLAFNSYQQASKISPQCIAAYLGMADLFRLHSNVNHALQVLSHALKIEPENSAARRQMIPLLAPLTPGSFNPELERDLLLCISEPAIDHQQLARVTGIHLTNKYPESRTVNDENVDRDLLQRLNNDTLFLSYLTQCINTNAALEQWLTLLRRHLLLGGGNTHCQELACALALQCFANEYVFPVSTEEKQHLMTLEQSVRATNKSFALPKLLLASMYQPLIDLAGDLECIGDNTATNLALLVKRTFQDLQQEQQYQANFRKIGNINADANTNSISDQVRNQYEENPYPRWQIPPAPAAVPLTHILQQLPGAQHSPLPHNDITVLIAGCGTGFEPIELARMDQNAQITALDLSSKSLAYARRMAGELQIRNVDFVQGNILDATKLNTCFDLINSTGVLHHMEEPTQGWKTLCGILKPGGVMRISLYSELARQRIALAHQQIKESGLGSSDEDIKLFRRTIFSLPTHSPLAELALSDDFYSLSGCRDLVFHVQEHRFSLLQLKEIIADLGLTLIGFDVPAWARQKFNQRYANSTDALDLNKWHEFELNYPDTFVGMYQLWLQKTEDHEKINPAR